MPGQQSRESGKSSQSAQNSKGVKNGGFATSEKDARHASGPSAGSKVERQQSYDDDVGSPPYADGNDAGPQMKQEGGGVDQRSQGSGSYAQKADRAGSQSGDGSDAGQGRSSSTEREGSSSRNGRGERTRDDRHGGSSRHRGIH